ncbi:MAG: ATP-binding protein [Coriobacteriales bacterium]|nr:ATP-binding protein [Coriobacteriales bacterium]
MAIGSAEREAMRRRAKTARAAGIRLALAYAVAAGLWILVSDQALNALGLPDRIELVLNSAKGFIFVIVTAVALYFFAVQALRAVQHSEERYHHLFENATEGVVFYRVIKDDRGTPSDFVVDDVNEAQLERSGLTCEQVVGQRMSAPEGLDEEMLSYFNVVSDAVHAGGPLHRVIHVEEDDAYTLVVSYRIEEDLWAVGGMDITEIRRAQRALRRQEERIRRAYVDVLDAVTGGKLVLMTEEEIARSLGTPLGPERPIQSPSELAQARATIRDQIATRYPQVADSMVVMNPVGEALNNVLKHADGGTYQVFATDDCVQVKVADDGPGIDFHTLPKAALVAGFSTAATLGIGFTLMLQLSDRLMLATRPGRTIVVLEASANGANPEG